MHLARRSARRRIPIALVLGPDASRFGSDERSLARGYKNPPEKSATAEATAAGWAAKWACRTKKIYFFCTERPLTSPRLLICSSARHLQ